MEQRFGNLEGNEELAIRRRVGMALVVVGQMLPEGAIKGGSAMVLRYGRGTRFTRISMQRGSSRWPSSAAILRTRWLLVGLASRGG
ncbi:hypothetical protein [Intrasporangium mesophilum]